MHRALQRNHLDKFRKKSKFNDYRYRMYYPGKKPEKIGVIELGGKVRRQI